MKKLAGFLGVALLVLGAGCGDNETVPSLDITSDVIQADTAVDTVTPVDTVTSPDTREDTVGVDNVTVPDAVEETVEDTNVEDTTVTDNVQTDVPVDATTDSVEDVPPTVCTSNADCDATEYCEAETCGGSGVCAAKPALCVNPIIIETVCACDGVTYDSECFANMAGANVGTDADCGGGGNCTGDGDCALTEYCLKEACGDADGNCTTKPLLCPLTLNPVCGCDGVTYNNSCFASAAGVSVDDTGDACSAVVTCAQNSDCASDFCKKTACDAAEGTCENVPAFCLVVGSGVCGCDGNSYTNECLASQAKVSVDPTGAACSDETTCTGNDDCAANEYCAKETCADASGVCTTTPTTCKLLGTEVCGCDKVVYPSACYAHRGRTNTQSIDVCTSDTSCTTNLSCGGKLSYCRWEDCTDLSGTCSYKPSSCEDATLFVCGCDETTYKNFCEAAKAGASVDYLGKCSLL